jgi:hypothetical protein
MIREFFKRLFDKWLCLHQWSEFSAARVKTDIGEEWIRRRYVCNKCGKIIKINKV